MKKHLRKKLDLIYVTYNAKKYVDPDPLLFLYDYPRVRDREIVGLIAASLAYGRVEMIMKTVGPVLAKMGPSPYVYVKETSHGDIERMFQGFKYRFATGIHLSNLIKGIKQVVNEYASLENCFSAGMNENMENKGETVLPGLCRLYQELNRAGQAGHLLADPQKTSACKRSHLFLRWMVRKDGVDPGGWKSVSPSQLIIPLDTHMYKIGTLLGFTRRKSPDKTCAREITAGFRRIVEQDPVKYDFSLTRFGIQQNLNMDDLDGFLNARDYTGHM